MFTLRQFSGVWTWVTYYALIAVNIYDEVRLVVLLRRIGTSSTEPEDMDRHRNDVCIEHHWISRAMVIHRAAMYPRS